MMVILCSYNKTKARISAREMKFQRFIPLELGDKLERPWR